MTTFVLVHGAWWSGEAWWKGVTEPLRVRGHRVFAPTLTGLGARSHLLGKSINLPTHVEDIVNLIKWEKLSGIVLAGHSYGGMVISGAAECVPAGTIASLVYLDALAPHNGQSVIDILGHIRAFRGDEDPVPVPQWYAGDDKRAEAIMANCGSPHPRASLTERIALSGAAERIARKVYVRASSEPGSSERTASRLRGDPSWRVEEIACGHMVMIDAPRETADILMRAAE
jgi:pimeloyl-ACP methyl ester carboxylesterase